MMDGNNILNEYFRWMFNMSDVERYSDVCFRLTVTKQRTFYSGYV